MLHGMNPHGSRSQSGSPFDFFHPVHIGIDEGLVGKVDTTKFEAVTSGSWPYGESHLLPRVQGGAFQSGWSCEGVFPVRADAGRN